MRLSKVLFQINYKRHFERIWKRQGRLQAAELKIPKELQEMGVVIKDAKEILLEVNAIPLRGNKKKSLPLLAPSVFHNQKYYYVMNERTQISENENQILALTKTVAYMSGLPKELNSLIGACALPNQDQLVQTSILQAQVWDSDQDKLPRKFNPELPSYVFKRPYGILHKKRVSGLIEKLTYLCDSAIGKYPGCLQRDKVIDAICNVAVERNGDSVTFQIPADVLLTSTQPLQSFASASEVEATKNDKVPDIYPIKPTLDLDKADEKPDVPASRRVNNANIHTLFVGQKTPDFWSPTHMLGRGIATCFAFAAKEAQMKYGVNVKKLPDPISVQCVYLDTKTFNFVAYQLNTLELEHNEGIKNQVWIDKPASLFDEVSEMSLITNYNPDIFPKILSFYVNGLHPTAT